MTPFARMWRPCWKNRERQSRRGNGAANWNKVGCALFQTFQKPLGLFGFCLYNGDMNGGGAHDEDRGHQRFFQKAVLPVAIAGLLYCIFKSACVRDGELDLLWLWILCGLPFGIHRMCVWIVPGGGTVLLVLNFIIGGIIGGFVLVWRLLVAAWYVPLTVYCLIVC